MGKGKQIEEQMIYGNMERFYDLRKRLFSLIRRELEIDSYCKPYEGAMEIYFEFPDYFQPHKDKPSCVKINLHCYVVGPGRHYTFGGKTFEEALDKVERWIKDREAEESELKELEKGEF